MDAESNAEPITQAGTLPGSHPLSLLDDESGEGLGADSGSDSPGTSFVWPPRDPTQSDAGEEPAHAQHEPSRFGRLIDSIETDLLGRTALAFDRWAARTGWQPDTPEDYCWRCAGSTGPHETDGEGCADCRGKRLPWDRGLRLGIYRDELRDEVLALKFHAWRPGGRGLGSVMGRVIERELARAQIEPSSARLVPIPTHPLRRIMRGVDHTLVLARAVSDRSAIPIARVLRARYRPEQVGLSATARAVNIRDAFRVSRGCLDRTIKSTEKDSGSSPRVWVLIDDVRTTGATFVAASKTLQNALKSVPKPGEDAVSRPEIWVFSVGVSGSRTRRDQSSDERSPV